MNAGTAAKEDLDPRRSISPAERSSSEKHEFFDGEIFAMAGASFEHNKIVANLVGELRSALRHRPCDVTPSDLRVKVPATGALHVPGRHRAVRRAAVRGRGAGHAAQPDGARRGALRRRPRAMTAGRNSATTGLSRTFREYVLVAQDMSVRRALHARRRRHVVAARERCRGNGWCWRRSAVRSRSTRLPESISSGLRFAGPRLIGAHQRCTRRLITRKDPR